MKLAEFVKNLNVIAAIEKYKDLDVVFSIDDEGNAFKEIHYTPALGNYEDNDFMIDEGDGDLINAICIN